MSFEGRSTEDLVRIAGAGGGFGSTLPLGPRTTSSRSRSPRPRGAFGWCSREWMAARPTTS